MPLSAAARYVLLVTLLSVLCPPAATAMDPQEPLTWTLFEEQGREPYCAAEPICVSPLRIMIGAGDGSWRGVWLPDTYRPFQQALSPDGRRVAFRVAGDSLWVMTRGGVPKKIYETDGVLQTPHWSSDGTKLIFDEGWNIKTINADGTGLRTPVNWRGTQAGGDFSPDGTRITFSSAVDSKGKDLPGGMQVFTASAVDGSSPVQVTRLSPQLSDGYAPVYSPDGNSIAFEGSVPTDDNPAAFQSQIHTIGVTGNGIKRLTFGVRSTGWNRDSEPAWSPDGQHIVFKTTRASPTTQPKYTAIFGIHKSGLGGFDLIVINSAYPTTGVVPGLETPTPRRHSSTYTLDHYLAHEFRPILRFDTGENWRPLNVERFLEEDFADGQPGAHHELCNMVGPGRSCTSVDDTDAAGSPDAWTKLRQYREGIGAPMAAWPVIAVHGEGDSPENFKSPRLATCAHDDLYDCDEGVNTALYYRASGPFPEANYRFYDYWAFYRFNKFDGGDHEADWEHITVARATAGSQTFAWAGLSAHNAKQFRYLRDVLRCDNNLAAGSCGTETGGQFGRRVVSFVSNGGHSNYPESCSAAFGSAECDRSTHDGQQAAGEKGYDGAEPWGANDDPNALLRWPDTMPPWDFVGTQPHWANWPGRWGLKDDKSDVESPGAPNRDVFYSPWVWECSERGTDDETNCPATAMAAFATGDCAAWAGPGVTASACSEETLAAGLSAGTVGAAMDDLSADMNGRARPAAASGGISQVAGPPLRPGQVLVLNGPIRGNAELRVRVVDAQGERIAYFAPARSPRRRIVVKFTDSVEASSVVVDDGTVRKPVRLARP